MKKFLCAALLSLCSILAVGQTQPAGIVFGSGTPISITGPVTNVFARPVPTPVFMSGVLYVSTFGVTGSGANCQPTLSFGSSTMQTNTSYIANSPLPPGQTVNTNQIYIWPVLLSSTSAPSGPFSSVSLNWLCAGSYPSSGTAIFEFLPNQYSAYLFIAGHITTNTNSALRSTAGVGSSYLHTIVINQAGTGETLTVFDGNTCAGTILAVLTGFTTGQVYTYDVQTANGLCVTSAGTTPGDYTVTYR